MFVEELGHIAAAGEDMAALYGHDGGSGLARCHGLPSVVAEWLRLLVNQVNPRKNSSCSGIAVLETGHRGFPALLFDQSGARKSVPKMAANQCSDCGVEMSRAT